GDPPPVAVVASPLHLEEPLQGEWLRRVARPVHALERLARDQAGQHFVHGNNGRMVRLSLGCPGGFSAVGKAEYVRRGHETHPLMLPDWNRKTLDGLRPAFASFQ